ncbi:MAG: aryl-sulfate sulfotransferase [Lachnospiraceae bacterium]|jgi:hypothetical protein|nr:aryl-sulfate sulfotransferase [Lachnospiraceae bacterium]MEE3460407.1 aryl-sulfate sulfotransferase [Lachnospiraceae bacterium]
MDLSLTTRVKNKLIRLVTFSDIKTASWMRNKISGQNIKGAFRGRKYETDLDKTRPLVIASHIKDRFIERQLDKDKYSLKSPLVILNPYGTSYLSAYVIFNTGEECKFSYIVKGMHGSPDIRFDSEILTKRHRVPVVALYENTLNVVKIILRDKDGNETDSNYISMYAPALPEPFVDCVHLDRSLKPMETEFLMVSGGYHGGTFVFDRNGNVRMALNRIPQYYGVYYLKSSGRFLFPELSMRRPAYGNAHTVITHEMDMMGRVSKTYYHLKGSHHWGMEKGEDGNILTLTSSFYDTRMENSVTEIDRNTGKTVFDISMEDLFDEVYKTRNDWCHINSVDYDENDDTLLLSLRNVHTLLKLDPKNREIKWILTNPEFYKGTKEEKLLLTPEDPDHIKWFFQQHALQIMHLDGDREKGLLHIMIFDNHTVNRRPVDYYDGDKTSNGMVFEIDEKKRTFKQVKAVNVPLSKTRSNVIYEPETNRLLVNCANLVEPIDGNKGMIYETDYETNEVINQFSFSKDYFAADTVKFNVDDLASPLSQDTDDFFKGELYMPKKSDIDPDKLHNADPVPADMINNTFRFRLYGDIFQIKCGDHDLNRIYFYNDSAVYEQDFTDTTQPLEIFKAQSYFMSMPLWDLAPGDYHIAIDYEGTLMNLLRHVEISEEK